MLESVLEFIVCKRRRPAFPASEDLYQIKRRKPMLLVPPTPLDRPVPAIWASNRGKKESLPALSDIKDPEVLYRRLISAEDEDNCESLKTKIRRLGEVVKLAEENLQKFRRDKETETVSSSFVPITESDFQPSCYFLSPDEELQVEQLWDSPDPGLVVGNYDNIPLSVKDLRTLRGSCWLNDEVVNSYGYLLSLVDKSVLVHNSYFFTLLGQRTPQGEINLQKIDRIHKRKKVESIFAAEKVLIPVNINNAHWVCYCIDHTLKTITYFDSFPYSQFNPLLSEYMQAELKRTHSETLAYTEEVAICPQQSNGVDCGAFMLMNMRNCVAGKQVHVEQEVMPQVRKMIALELKIGELRG